MPGSETLVVVDSLGGAFLDVEVADEVIPDFVGVVEGGVAQGLG